MTDITSEFGDVTWDKIKEAGSIQLWITDELKRRDLIDEVTDTSSMSEKERKRYKARREEERRVKAALKKLAWSAYRKAHLVHLGLDIFYHDVADVDRFDIADGTTRLKDNQLPELKDAEALAKALEITMGRLRWLSYHRDVDSNTHYHRWTVPKRSGGERLISAPKPELKRIQRWIARNITEHLPIHGAAHGFIPQRSTVTNASIHAGARLVLKFDLKDFYPTVTFPRVKGLFRKAGFGEQVATVLAMLCTESPRRVMEMNGKTYHVAIGPRSIPQGAPTSPSISNTICLKLDSRLSTIASRLGLAYTRYADDLTFSYRGKGPAPISKLLGSITRVVSEEGFEIHPKKTRIMRSGRRQTVTGLVVNSAGRSKGRDEKLDPPVVGSEAAPARVPRTVVRRLRAAIKNRELGREGKGESLAQLAGMASYINMTDQQKGRRFLDRLAELDRVGQRQPSSAPAEGDRD